MAFNGRVRGFDLETVSLHRGYISRWFFLDLIDCLLLCEHFVVVGRSGCMISAFFRKLRVEVDHWIDSSSGGLWLVVAPTV